MSEEKKEYDINNFVGKQVKIAFNDGKSVMYGEIRYIKKYEIYLKSIKSNNIIMIFKHAIKYITLTTDKES